MGTRSQYPAGTFCWIDLATSDQRAAREYYGKLLGWSYLEVPNDDDTTCSMATIGDLRVAGIRPLPEDVDSPHWLSYVTVDSADDAARRAADLGGKILIEPTDVLTSGRMTVVQDPGGAMVSAWEPRDHFGAALVNQHGTLCWNELNTRDTAAAAAFYTGWFGWTTEPFGDKYTVFINGDRPAGGMMEIEQQDPASPDWSVYFCVDDCDAVHKRGIALGGSVCMPPADFPDVGRGCFLRDPQGGGFGVINLLNPPD